MLKKTAKPKAPSFRPSFKRKPRPKAKQLESHNPLYARPEQERVLFIDQSTTAAGYAMATFIEGKTPAISCGCISPKKSAHIVDRVDEILKTIDTMIREFEADAVCIEDTRFSGGRTHGKRSTEEALAAIAFGILAVCHRAGVPFYRQNPITIKATGAGYGRASKEDMKWAASQLVGYEIKNDNTADAVLAAKSWNVHRESIVTPKVKVKKAKPLF